MAGEVRWLDEEQQATWRSWLAVSELLRSQIGRDLQADAGLSEADFVVLVVLSEHPERRIRMTDLAEQLRWSKSRLSHQVARMEGRGLLERANCPSDARGSFAVLTDAGLAEIQRAAPLHVESVRRHFIDVLDRDQLAALRQIADQVVEHLEAAGARDLPACPDS